MPPALCILQIITPAITLLPTLPLCRPIPEAQSLPGIRAVTIKTVTPRRSFILTTLVALALTHALECADLILDLLATSFRKQPHSHSTWVLVAAAVHGLGGVAVYSLTGIFAEWRTRWGDKNLVVLALLAFGLEVPILVLTIVDEVHSCESRVPLAASCTEASSSTLYLDRSLSLTCRLAGTSLLHWPHCMLLPSSYPSPDSRMARLLSNCSIQTCRRAHRTLGGHSLVTFKPP